MFTQKVRLKKVYSKGKIKKIHSKDKIKKGILKR